MNRDLATSSSSLLMPTSPARACVGMGSSRRGWASPVAWGACRPAARPPGEQLTLCSSARERDMRTSSLLKRSSSCSSTTDVGLMLAPRCLRTRSKSKTLGILFSMSLATLPM